MLEICQASPEMAGVVAPLIVSSGANSLRTMFEVEDRFNTEDFIHFAFVQDEGQFSYSHHFVALYGGEVAGVASCWTNKMTAACRNATIESLVAYFGAALVPQIVERSVLLQSVIPAPKPDGLGVGHVAVAEKYRRKGVASALINALNDTAIELGKTHLELDVECDNHPAINLYQKQGFNLLGTTVPGDRAAQLGFTAHHHMQKFIGA